MKAMVDLNDGNYYNHFDSTPFDEKDTQIYDFENRFPNIFTNIENIISGFCIAFLFTFIFVSIILSNDLKTFWKTFYYYSPQNRRILYDCFNFQNPIVRVLNKISKQEYNRRISVDDYYKILQKFDAIEKNIFNNWRELDIKRFQLKVLKFQKQYSDLIGVPLYDIKELNFLNKKFENIEKLKNLPKTCIIAINELTDNYNTDSETEVRNQMKRMKEIRKTMIISGKTQL